MSIKIFPLGHGGAFAPLNVGQSNFILTAPSGKHLLFDCGTDCRHLLDRAHYSWEDIDAVYISHLHADHAGGLEWLGFIRKFSNTARPKLFAHADIPIWHYLKHGMRALVDKTARISTYFDYQPFFEQFQWEGIHFESSPIGHISTGKEVMFSYGVVMNQIGSTRKCYISGDACITSIKECERADLILHDCETYERVSHVHIRLEDLDRHLSHIKEKMLLYHYADNGDVTLRMDLQDKIRGMGFKGLVKQGNPILFEA